MWIGKLFKGNIMQETEERPLQQVAKDSWKECAGTVHVHLREKLDSIAEEISRRRGAVCAVYNAHEQRAELVDEAGNVLAEFLARGVPNKLEGVLVTPYLLSEAQMFQIISLFDPVQVVFLK